MGNTNGGVTMPSKRRFGTINKLPSGNYRARYLGPDGARYSAPHTFETKAAAEAWLADEWKLIEWDSWTSPTERQRAEQEAQEAEADALAKVRTLEQTYTHYLEWRVKPLGAATLTDYEKEWRLRIEPHWGAGRDIAEITNEQVWQWRKGELGKETRRDHAALALFKGMLKRATEWGWIPRNPADGVTIPRKRVATAKREAFTLEQTKQYLQAAEPHHVAMLATVALAGLRSGEVRALRRCDIDLKNRELHVRQAVEFGKDAKGKWVKDVKAPKTDAGTRTVPFGTELERILKEHFKHHPAMPAALAFPAPDGEAYGPAEIDRRHNQTLASMGLRMSEAEKRRLRRKGKTVPKQAKGVTLHELRASYAAWLFTQGYEVPEVMSLMGWSDSRMPLEVYARVFPNRVAEVGKRQDEALGQLNVVVS